MSISYSGIRNYGKATLPSVSGGLGSLNIIKDPHKSITTRRINKVGETSGITSMIDDSGNRNCEAISVFARSVNPMVSVSYENNGNGNGTGNGSIVNQSGRGQVESKLPYRIIEGGAFYPPTVTEFNKYPLSRLPRTSTSAFTSKDFPDFMKKAMCPQSAENTIGVKNSLLHTSIRPTASYKLETPISENFEVKYVIKNPIKISATSGTRSLDVTSQTINTPIKETNKKTMNIYHETAKGSLYYTIDSEDNKSMLTSRYLQNPMYSNVNTNISRQDITNFSDNNDISTDRYLQEYKNIDVNSNISRKDITNFSDNNDISTDRYLQEYKNIDVNTNISRQDITNFSDNNDISTDRYLQEYKNIDVNSNVTGNTTKFNESHFIDTDRYLQNNINIDVQSKPSNNIQVTPIDEIFNTNIRTKDHHNISYKTISTREGNNNYIHDDILLEKNTPLYQTNTNINKNIYHDPTKNNQKYRQLQSNRPVTQIHSNIGSVEKQKYNNQNRNHILKPTITYGSFEGKASKPMTDRIQNVNENFESHRAEMSRKINSQMDGRYGLQYK